MLRRRNPRDHDDDPSRGAAADGPGPGSGEHRSGDPREAAPGDPPRRRAPITRRDLDEPRQGHAVRVLRRDEHTPAVPPPSPAPPAAGDRGPESADAPHDSLLDAGPEARPAPRARRANRVIGVNLDGGGAFIAVVEGGSRPSLVVTTRLEALVDVEPGARLAEFSRQCERVLHESGASSVAIARPMRHSDWRYADAAARASLETCFALVAHAAGIDLDFVGQHHAANVVGLPFERLADTLPAKLSITKPPNWTNLAPAILVALARTTESR